MSHEIVRYRPDLRPGIIALQKHLVSADPGLNDAYFRWKHEENPYTPEPIVYVALSNGEVAGMRGFMGARWRLGDDGATASWLCACDLVIDPAHRGAKLFRQIMAYALADLAEREAGPTLNWSASPITYGASRRSGWQLIVPYAPWRRQTRRARIVRALASRARRWPLTWRYADVPASLLRSGFGALDAAWASAPRDAPLRIAREPRPDEMASLVRALPSRVSHERDATYYRWRFRNPLCSYRFLYWNEPALEAFVVLQVARSGAADIAIVDWESTNPEHLGAMLSALVEVGGYDSLSIWTASLPAGCKARLAACGFADADDTRGDPGYRPGLLAVGHAGSDLRTASSKEAALLSSPSRWDLRMLYSDFY